ncbi:helix-turn-helix domain-containing protein [Streptomyces coeruleorubidus]|uniref:helix-turn-helix domain-containing protein n=1 Tax=Streptomyces coeruleorubidus TaxID=116188 RepID=UPI00237FA140|nr:helix-turn-helix domain-containing protein [Streptomyces coeruleorubidus]WDV54324.1 helix-turn-helix domain-containing protein [Streptomyces coeruleorubidus]
MGTQNPSVPPHAQARVAGNKHPNRRPGAAHRTGGLQHDNARHTTRFTVIGNHLAQHKEFSLLAIGLGTHLQSLPKGAPADIKTLAARFPEGATRIAAALRELEAHGYLRRERVRTSTGRIVTRTISCNQPTAARHRPETHDHPEARAAAKPQQREACEESRAHPRRAARGERAPRKPLPDVPRPAYPAPALLEAATDLLADLRRHDPRLLLSACDTAHLAPGVAAWLERDVAPAAVRRALSADLPPEGVRRPAALLAHRLAAQLPPPAPFRAPAVAPPPPARHPMQNCDGCDRGFRAPRPGRCRDCRSDLQEAA